MPQPLAYFITFTRYGHWLHGDQRGSVDRNHNQPQTPWVIADDIRRERKLGRMDEPAFELGAHERQLVREAISDVCRYRGWRLWAAHARSRHVRLVITAVAKPEKVMNELKAYASRALNVADPRANGRKRWTRHGSTRYINDQEHLERVIRYVLEEQGTPQAVFDGRREQ